MVIAFALKAVELGGLGLRPKPWVNAAHAAHYARLHANFAARRQQAMARSALQAATLKCAPVVSQHKAFGYRYDWLGPKAVAVFEPEPGIEASASHLRAMQSALHAPPACIMLHAACQDPRRFSGWVSIWRSRASSSRPWPRASYQSSVVRS